MGDYNKNQGSNQQFDRRTQNSQNQQGAQNKDRGYIDLDEILKKAKAGVENLNKDNVKDFVYAADKFAKEIENISHSKLRNFYDAIKQIFDSNEDWDKKYKELYLIKPKITYAVGRADKDEKYELKKFQELYDKLIEILNENNSNNFLKFFEAIIAYHKVYAKKK